MARWQAAAEEKRDEKLIEIKGEPRKGFVLMGIYKKGAQWGGGVSIQDSSQTNMLRGRIPRASSEQVLASAEKK